MTKTNETTRFILNELYKRKIFAWRQNIAGIPLPQGGFRPAGKSGLPDIIAILPPDGHFLGIEVKTGKDRLRLEQVGFILNAERMGAKVLIVKDFEDFKTQLDKILSTSYNLGADWADINLHLEIRFLRMDGHVLKYRYIPTVTTRKIR